MIENEGSEERDDFNRLFYGSSCGTEEPPIYRNCLKHGKTISNRTYNDTTAKIYKACLVQKLVNRLVPVLSVID